MSDEALPLSAVLREEYVRLHGPLPDDTVAALDAAAGADAEAVRLKAIYAAIHKLDGEQARTAFCISGGGIRSATFALGVMQRLASFGLLKEMHYVSTISGGGYIGSWLSSFVRRNPGGIADVEDGIKGIAPAKRDPLMPEIEPLRWLRAFSNYLTPKLGLMSGDTWAFVGSYVRNLLLVWLMFVPIIAAMLALPRLAMALLRMNVGDASWPTMSGLAACALILIGTLVIACTRPVSHKNKGWLTNGRFLRVVLLPYFVAAMLIVFYWSACYRKGVPWRGVLLALIVINLFSALIYMALFFRGLRKERQGNVAANSTKRRYAWKKLLAELLAAVVAGGVTTALLYAATQLFANPTEMVKVPTVETWKVLPPALTTAPGELFLVFGVPLLLGILFVQSAVFIGGASWYNEEYDREWWGRAAGWVLLAGVGWIAGAAITIYGPVLIYEGPRLYTALAGGTGLVAILLGKSGSSSATNKDKDETASKTSAVSGIALGLVAPIFAVCVLALISLCTSKILLAVDPTLESPPRIAAPALAKIAAGTYQIKEDIELPQGKGNFETRRFAAGATDSIAAIEHLWAFDRTSVPTGFILVFGLALWSWFVSFFIGANQFSMHGLYRNRLIRGYLGASRYSRRANAFSGFDPNDNLPMDRLRPELFWPSTFRNVARDGKGITATALLKDYIQQDTIDAVADAAANPGDAELCGIAADLLADDLNDAVAGMSVSGDDQRPPSVRNREALELRFPDAFYPMSAHQRPLHVVGMTLNLVGGDDLAWQERKGETFAVSPLFSGGLRVGYRRTLEYGGPDGVSLGTAVAISGAAASPNMGYNSSSALSFLLTLFNVRLGWWLGNPKKPTYKNRNPSNTLMTVLSESFGLTNDEANYIYLSDGGHFENLGLYEMVLRRCHCIILSDAGADPKFGFDDLGNAIRKVRVDLGINIEITDMDLFPRSDKDPLDPKYCAVATIHYSDVDPGAPDGHLLYLKPAFYGKQEPKDVYNYASVYEAFPHQSTGDQWFSESQFESYRQLGYFALGKAANGKPSFNTLCELIEEARSYIGAEREKTAKAEVRSEKLEA